MGDFYPAFSATCFVVLTLWMMMVQARFDTWQGDPERKAIFTRAFGVGLFFSLPGVMTLISLVDPTSPRLWELTYTIVALGGAVTLAILFRSGSDGSTVVTAIGYGLAIVLYLAIGVIAIIGLNHHPASLENHVDQVLLCVLLFLGVNVAWWLLIRDAGRSR